MLFCEWCVFRSIVQAILVGLRMLVVRPHFVFVGCDFVSLFLMRDGVVWNAVPLLCCRAEIKWHCIYSRALPHAR